MGLEQINEFIINNLILLIVVIYMAAMIAIGYFVQRKGADKSAENYLIANKGVGPLRVGGTVFSTNWCGGVLLGAAGTAYTGYVVSTIADPWATCLTLVLMAIFFCAILRKLKIASLSEMYRLRFGKRGATVATVMCIPSMITWTAANIVALTTIFKLFLDFDPMICAIIAGLIVVLYTYLGGMLAVVYTDNIQAVMIMLGLIILIPTGIAFVGGLDVLTAATPENFWNLLPNDGAGAVATGFTVDPLGIFTWLAGLSGMGFGYLASVELTQRVLCARDTKAARQGLLIGSGMYALAGFFSMMIALIAIVMVSQGTTTPAGSGSAPCHARTGCATSFCCPVAGFAPCRQTGTCIILTAAAKRKNWMPIPPFPLWLWGATASCGPERREAASMPVRQRPGGWCKRRMRGTPTAMRSRGWPRTSWGTCGSCPTNM